MMNRIKNSLSDIGLFGASFVFGRLAARLFAQKTYSVSVPRAGKFSIRPKTSDLALLRDVFGSCEYDIMRVPHGADIKAAYEAICASGATPLIIDAGANNGATAVWFSNLFPKAKIIAIEPDPENAHMCRLNTGRFPNVEVLEAAIGGESGLVNLSDHPSGVAVQTQRSKTDAGVQVCTIPQVVAANGSAKLFFVKVDIEGFEGDLFSANTSWIDGLKALFIEPHDWMLPKQFSSWGFQRTMAQHKFELVIMNENLLYVS
jgi:FkbM family methyltransferase